MKLVHLVGFITKKFVTMHGQVNVKLVPLCLEVIILRGKVHAKYSIVMMPVVI